MALNPTPRKRGDLTKRQLEAMRVILTLPRPVGLAELAQHLGLTKSSANDRLKWPMTHLLVEWRHLGRGPANMKVLGVTPRGLNALAHHGMLPRGVLAPGAKVIAPSREPFNIPCYSLSCGEMKEALAEPTFIQGPADFFHNYRVGDYMADADGDSMENEGDADSIYRGDKVLLRPDICPANGEQVHAEYQNPLSGVRECTLKVFHLDEHTQIVTLSALNREYSPITLPASDVYVHGVVMDVIHRSRRNSRK